MFPLGMLATLALGSIAGYQYSKHKNKNSKNNSSSSTDTDTSDNSTAKNINTYNYYSNESEDGNTLFGSKKKTKRTLFGGDIV